MTKAGELSLRCESGPFQTWILSPDKPSHPYQLLSSMPTVISPRNKAPYRNQTCANNMT